MKKLMVPAVLALALTAGGAAFAASSADAQNAYLYARPSPFAVPQETVNADRMAAVTDQRLNPGSQQASMSGGYGQQPASSMSHTASETWTDAGQYGDHGPE